VTRRGNMIKKRKGKLISYKFRVVRWLLEAGERKG
jgi:hypothetical protein